MKIASYNIMNGGFNTAASQTAAPERLPVIQQAIRQIDADVIGLIDTYMWDTLFTPEQLKEMFGYDYVMCVNLKDDRLGTDSNGLTLLSKQPWTTCETVRIANRNAIKVAFEADARTITIALAYLDDQKEATRLQQVQALFSLGPVDIVLGDLNTVAPADNTQTAAAVEDFYAMNPSLRVALGPAVQEMLHSKVIPYIETQGFKDAGINAGNTMPTDLFPAVTTEPLLRLDYCMYGSDVQVSNFVVHHTAAARDASDHLPISFTVT